MKIGILGGTFDPVHEGHLALARHAQKQFQFDKVIFIPAFVPPHKTRQRTLSPAPYRYRMVELAIKNEPRFEISDIEFCRADLSFTVDTLAEMKKRFPKDDLYLILGEDSLAEMGKWKDPDQIKSMVAGLVVAHRPGHPAEQTQEKVLWVDMPECAISSSEIRRQMTAGTFKNAGVIPAEVERYISSMNLYQKGPQQ